MSLRDSKKLLMKYRDSITPLVCNLLEAQKVVTKCEERDELWKKLDQIQNEYKGHDIARDALEDAKDSLNDF